MAGSKPWGGGRRALSMRVVRVVVLGNGAAGAEKQALALGSRVRDRLLATAGSTDKGASSLNCPPVDCVRVALSRSPLLRLLPPALQVLGARVTQHPFFGYANAHEVQTRLQSMKPGTESTLNVVIGCGRSTVALCAVLKQLDAGRTFNIQIQHPRVPLAWFDAVVAPRHDFSADDNQIANLFVTPGTVHDISNALLQRHEHEWYDELDAKLLGRRTRIVWLVGGPCRGFQFTAQDAERMADQFERALPRDADVAVLVTFSRRTPAEVQHVIRQRLRASLSMQGQALVWDGTERRNPYYALLATASIVVTTPDSISMTTEAIASGKPVFTISVEHSKGKFQRFHRSLFESNATMPFTRDAVTAALLRCSNQQQDDDGASSSAASIALENELSTIVNALTKNIHSAVGRLP